MSTDPEQQEFKVWVGAGFHRVRAANVIEAASSVLTRGLLAEEIFKVEKVACSCDEHDEPGDVVETENAESAAHYCDAPICSVCGHEEERDV